MMGFLYENRIQAAVTFILFFLVFLFMLLSPQTFLSGRIYMAYMATIPFAGIMALAMTFVVTAGEIDLSFPSVLAASGYAFAVFFELTGIPLAGVLAGLAVGVLAGLLNGLLVVGMGVPAIIATIGTQFFWRGATILVADGLALSLTEIRGTLFHDLVAGRLWGIFPAQFLWFAGLFVLFALVHSRHVFGDAVRFVGDNALAARTMGIAVARTRILVFVLMGLCAALSGILLTTEMASWWPTQGEGYMLIVFASVFIGGTSVYGGAGTMYGTLVGAIIIGIIEAGILASGLSGFWTRMVHGCVILFAVSLFAWMQAGSRRL